MNCSCGWNKNQHTQWGTRTESENHCVTVYVSVIPGAKSSAQKYLMQPARLRGTRRDHWCCCTLHKQDGGNIRTLLILYLMNLSFLQENDIGCPQQ
ncbi:hypothetical protein GJAV_G00001220 [Gymnothorax javanicus]|nr:hypothetical protein GJAV_G00001220 [Gymnothorax javanicus]